MSSKIINVSNLKFKYTDSTNFAVNDLSFDINEGEWVSIIGKNGSGKSTLISLLDGLLKAQSGSIKVDGIALNEDTVNDIRDRIGIVFQDPNNQFVASTVQDDIAFGLENRNMSQDKMKAAVEKALTDVDMLEYAEKDPTRLSGGQKQRVAIAGILAMNPKIIILDEATSMLDPKAKYLITNLINEVRAKYNLTVLSISHDINEIEKSDRTILIRDGKMVLDTTPQKLFTELDNVEEYGLKLPFSEQLRLGLKEEGFDISDDYLNDEEIVEWITQYYSKM
ncbi:ABC superfamily ATP binding cassette transporter, ABC protein [Apilactobacillus kunkeei DSM 12361 = ATCC 700308]|uniref:ABC superfamily ATP binding cassette transporter, ABC protein n=1 Tax=Apilactobacillus kunkeei DSM 12361 = ATCC 700308 TaxID=1423768 RepID=A0A0R1FS75_9LACO|nr:Cobalt ABC transporter, ATP-binding protein [Apilactobacillus kunkeei DSM 12361 = ATCC 700308]KRK22369.1 ABC superfamily ATP binding cassette transporter, ABC protein [Apilactobacillus kunkeei DSM 12361 = ATCC 700308]